MSFNDQLEEIRLFSNYENEYENEPIDNLNTLPDIVAENKRLIEYLAELRSKAFQGQDVIKKLRHIQEKVKIIKELGFLIAKYHKNKEKVTIEKDVEGKKSFHYFK